MELTSESKREICRTYDQLLDERNHITAYLDETYYKGIFGFDEELGLDTKAIHVKRAETIAADIQKYNSNINATLAFEYIMNPDFQVGIYLPERTVNPYVTTLEDAFLYRKVEDQIVLGSPTKCSLEDAILPKTLVPALRIRKVSFTKNIFIVIIKETYLLPRDASKFQDNINVANSSTIKGLWHKIYDRSYATTKGKIERIFISHKDFQKFLKEEYGAELNEEWIETGIITLDNRITRPSLKNPDIEEIRTLEKQRKYYKA